MLTQEQAEQIKKQLIDHINSTFPEDKREFSIQQLNSMNNEQLEQFVIQNKLVKDQDKNQQCVFCLIVSGEASSYKIAENEQAIAILEINPISKSHSIIIPKIHSEETPQQAFNLAQEISEKISQAFKPKKVEIIESTLFGHKIVNVLPIYKDENIHSPKQQAKPEELQEIQKILTKTEKPKTKKLPKLDKPKPLTDKDTWLPKRIP